jgi:hypothetical protein
LTNLLEDFVAQLNSNIYLREFTFAKNQFIPDGSTQLEFADHVVWLDDLLMIFQLKQREAKGMLSEEGERNWFQKKVVRKGSSQIRDTLSYLQQYSTIAVKNQRNHEFNLALTSQSKITKLIVYLASEALPGDCGQTHYHNSETGGGFIHILPWHDYLGIARNLITPLEISSYFEFRENIIVQQVLATRPIPSEQAIVGHFLSGSEKPPSEEFKDYLATLKREDFDLSSMLHVYADRIDRSAQAQYDPTDYYAILKEFVKLHRVELREIKKRLNLCLDAVQADKFMRPTRLVTRNGCGFVFIPVDRRMSPYRQQGLMNLTIAAKYDSRLQRQIGIAIAKEEQDILMESCFLDYFWKYDEELEEWLETNSPFLPMTKSLSLDYKFED